MALAVFAMGDVQSQESAPHGNLVQPSVVEVEEPFPAELVVPAEPLPPGEESLEPLPAESAPSSTRGVIADESELLSTLERWAQAWGDQQVESYLSFYAEGFETPDEMARHEWESKRRERLLAPAFIKVTVEAPQVQLISESQGQVEFIQRYTSDRFQDIVRKTLELIRAGDRWKILREQSEVLAGG